MVNTLPAGAGDVTGGFDPWVGKISLKESMAAHSSAPAWRMPRPGEPGGLQPVGLQESQTRLTEHITRYILNTVL